MASAVNGFLTKHLNVWVSADTAWMDMRAWDRCKDETLDIEDFTDDPCWIALDLATKTDIAAMALCSNEAMTIMLSAGITSRKRR
jgi:phage terminase large subunit-like protein